MARILSHPFRLGRTGEAVTVEQDTDPANAEQLAVLVLTRLGERTLVPSFGIPDPAFGELDRGALAAAVELHGPPVSIEALEVAYPTETTQEVTVAFA